MADTSTLTLTEFLLARIAEDEQRAAYAESRDGNLSDHDTAGWWLGHYQHYTRHDPARVLRECEAKRRIVEQLQRHGRLVEGNAAKHAEASRGGLDNQEQITALRTHGWELRGRLDALQMVVDSLAAVYADHPDYRDEWRS